MKTIVLAHEEDTPRYNAVSNVVGGIVFLGTPHRGASGATDMGKTIGTVINSCLDLSQTKGITGSTRVDLLKTLSANSESLKDLASTFRRRLNNLKIVTFYETETYPPLSYMVRC
jgi:hypothetical protein